ncbi:hypothetical protein AVEN_270830-1 [Araneus ventricosus]|uniref:Uncharacterized protein n=1 Tax=Araneus ventricosus TaxID=182803 RepID=A0A4Y2HZ91_ARAVE|nr:hypothetical protein AVEN_270830-1 [Araneus ventricosus]
MRMFSKDCFEIRSSVDESMRSTMRKVKIILKRRDVPANGIPEVPMKRDSDHEETDNDINDYQTNKSHLPWESLIKFTPVFLSARVEDATCGSEICVTHMSSVPC